MTKNGILIACMWLTNALISQVTCFAPPDDPYFSAINLKNKNEIAAIEKQYKNTVDGLEDNYFFPFGNRADGLRSCKAHKIIGCSVCSKEVREIQSAAAYKRDQATKTSNANRENSYKSMLSDYCKSQTSGSKPSEETTESKKTKDDKFVALTDAAEKLEKEGKYAEAKEKYKEAKDLRPNTNSWLDAKITSVDKKVEEKKTTDAKKSSSTTKETSKDSKEKKKEFVPPPKSAETIYMEQKTAEHKAADKQYKQNAAEANAAMVSAAAGIFKIWDLFQSEGKNHEYSDISSHFAVDIGLNIANMPLALNTTSNLKNNLGVTTHTDYTTAPESPIYTNLLVGLSYFPILSNKLSVGFHSKIMVGPSFEAIIGGGSVSQIGSSSVNYSASGFDLVSQSGAELHIGRLITSLDYIIKKWNYTTSSDSYDYSTGLGYTSYSDGSSKSSTFRYGVGVKFLKFERKTNFDLMVMLDNLSYYNNTGSIFNSPLVFKARLWDQSFGKATFEFAPSYPVAGIPLYSKDASYKSNFSLSLALNITRFKPHAIHFNFDEIVQSNERRGELIGYVDYSFLETPAFSNNVSAIGLNLKYKKVINSPEKENYIDFQMAGNGTMASTQNEYEEFETIRILNFSPDFRFTKKIIPDLYVGLIAGLASTSIRNTIPYYDARVKFDSQHYFLQGSVGATIGLMYSRKKALILNYYYRPSIIGKGSSQQIELELAYKVLYLNCSYIKLPPYNAGYIFGRNFNMFKFGIGCRMPW